MGLINTYKFTRQIIEWDKFSAATGNKYRLVSLRPYHDRKGALPDGVVMTLTVLQDNLDYGVDKTGIPRDNNLFQNFDVTVLSKVDAKKGDMIQLEGFDAEHSFAIGFDLLLRFKSCKVLPVAGAKANA